MARISRWISAAWVPIVAAALAGWGCTDGGADTSSDSAVGSGDADADTDTDADADADTSSDSATGSDTAPDTGTGSGDADTDTDAPAALLFGRVVGVGADTDADTDPAPISGARVFRYAEYQWPDGDPETASGPDGGYSLADLPAGEHGHIVADGSDERFGRVASAALLPGETERDLELTARSKLEAIAADGGVSLEPETGVVVLTSRADAHPEVQRWGPIGDAVDLGDGRTITFNIPDEHAGRGFVEIALSAEAPPPPTAHGCDTLGREGVWDDSRPVLVIDDHVSEARVHCTPNVAISEIHPCAVADVNGDLAVDEQDRFVEIVNTTDEIIWLDGWWLADGDGAPLHFFGEWDCLDPGASAVVFSGGEPGLAETADACVHTASEGGLGLGSGPGAVALRDADDRAVDRASWSGDEVACGVSLARPIDFDVAYEDHPSASELVAGPELSPGRDNELAAFAPCEALSVDLYGVVTELDYQAPDGGPPVYPGAEVAILDHPELGTQITDGAGGFHFVDVPHHERLHVRVTPPDAAQWGAVQAVELGVEDLFTDVELFPDALVQDAFGQLVTIDPNAGMVFVGVEPGVSAALTGAPGATAIALDGTTPVLGDTALPGSENVIFVNVPLGDDVGVTVTPPASMTCVLADEVVDSYLPLRVLGHHRTDVRYDCQ